MADEFLVIYPLWSLQHPTALSRGLVALTSEQGQKGFPLFTDQDLAERFRGATPGLAHYVLGSIGGPKVLLEFLESLGRKGFTHVVIDPTSGRGAYYSLDQIRGGITQRGVDPGAGGITNGKGH